MKRVTFATLSRRGEDLLRLLQRLSVLHPEHVLGEAELGSLDDIRHRLNVQAAIIKELEESDAEVPEGAEPEEGLGFSNVDALFVKLRDMDDRIKARGRLLAQLEPWGDFSPDDVEALREEGLHIGFWSTAAKPDEIRAPEGALVKPLGREGGRTFFVTLGLGEGIPEGAAEEALPDERLADVEADLERLHASRTSVLSNIGRAKLSLDKLKEEQERAEREYDYRVTVKRAFDDGDVKAFGGWIPAGREEAVRSAVEEFDEAVVVESRDPLPEENPPVLTKNASAARMLEPLLRLLGVPDYKGLDPALFFAPFMMLFFGICLGDIGYGASMIIGGLLLKRIFRKGPAGRVAGNITVLFGIASIVVGILTGSLFGMAPFGREWIPIDVSFDHGNPMILFKISIALGIIHLTIAFLLAAISEPSWQAKLSKIGSIGVLWGGALMVVGVSFWWAVLAAGLIIVLLFFSDARNPLKRIGLGLWGIYNHVSLVGDVMSYSRLFGLGIATAAIATVVNQLAEGIKADISSPAIGVVASIAVLIVGHLFNLAMGIISALVHPARLHAVEALPKFVHFDGIEYKPLASD